MKIPRTYFMYYICGVYVQCRFGNFKYLTNFMCCIPVFALHCSCPLRIKYPYRDISKHFGEKIRKANSPKIEKKFLSFFSFFLLAKGINVQLVSN